MKKVAILSLLATIGCVVAWPVGTVLYIIAIVMFIIEWKKENSLASKIDFLAKQLNIPYGTPEEKLEQIAYIAAKGQNRD